MEVVGGTVGIREDRSGVDGSEKPWAVGERFRLSHLAQGTGPGFQTVSSICPKMLDPPPSKDELKGKGEPEEKVRLGRKKLANEGAVMLGMGKGKGVAQ